MNAERTLLIRLFGQGKYTLFMALVEKGVYFLLFAFLARELDTGAYGTVVALFTFVNILHAFFELGFGAYIQREVSSSGKEIASDVGTVVLFKTAAFIPFAAIVGTYIGLSQLPFTSDTAAIIVTVYLSGMAAFLAKVLYGKGMFRESFTVMASSRIIVPAGVAVILLFDMPASRLLLALCAAVTFQSVTLLSVVNGVIGRIRWSFNGTLLKRILRSSLPMGLGVSFVWTYDKMDVLLIQHMIDPASVALYAVAYSIYKLPQSFSGILLSPLYTVLSSSFSRDGKLHLDELKQTAAVLIGTSMVMIAVMNVIPEFLLTLAFGERYAASSGALRLLSLALPALFLNNLTGVMLNAVRRETAAMTSALAALVLNVGLNIALLPILGITGAVITTIVTEYTIAGIQIVMLLRSGLLYQERPA